MTNSHGAWFGTILVLAASLPLNCREAVRDQSPPLTEEEANASSELSARRVTDEDIDAPAEKGAAPAREGKRPELPWETAGRIELERIQRERRTQAKASSQIALRTDTATIVPCQPLYVTVKVTNATNEPRKLDDLLHQCGVRVLVARKGAQPSLVDQTSGEGVIVCGKFSDDQQRTVPGKESVFFDRMLTKQQIIGARYNDPAPQRIFPEPGEYNVYAAFVYQSRFEVLRSDPLIITVREPTESEVAFVEFFRDGRQIPPHYGFSKVDEEAFDKVRGQGLRTMAFRRKLNAETIEKLRGILAKHRDPPVADDMRHYLMVTLIGSAKRYDERGHDQGYDRDVLAAAAQQYLDIDPKRKQLRRRGINTWNELSTRFDLDHAQPMLQILASWKVSSPFYEDEVESQAALDKIIDKIESRYAEHARQRAAARPPKPKLPTD